MSQPAPNSRTQKRALKKQATDSLRAAQDYKKYLDDTIPRLASTVKNNAKAAARKDLYDEWQKLAKKGQEIVNPLIVRLTNLVTQLQAGGHVDLADIPPEMAGMANKLKDSVRSIREAAEKLPR